MTTTNNLSSQPSTAAAGGAAVSGRADFWQWFIVFAGREIIAGPFPKALIDAELTEWRKGAVRPTDLRARGFDLGTATVKQFVHDYNHPRHQYCRR